MLVAVLCLPLPAAQAEPVKNTSAEAALSPITIDITTHLGDRQSFEENDRVSFFLNLDKDAYIMVVYVDAAGDRYQVIPNKYQSKHFYPAGLFIPIPPADADYGFKIAAPFGEESLWVFASDRPLAMYAGKFLANGLKKLSVSLADLRASIRSQALTRYGDAQLLIHTRARP